MTEWRDVTLAGVSDRVDYGYTASAADDPDLPRFLRITDIAGSHIDWSSVPGCVVDDGGLKKYALRSGDIVVARTGATVGHAKRIRQHPESVFASYLVRFRPSADVDPSYVGAIVESQVYKDYVLQNAGGSAQPNANARVLGSFPFLLPDRGTQEKVGQIVDALDDLIENNRRRIELLEQMAQAIYREWFVRFRYPGHEDVSIVDSSLGPIPVGWKAGKLDDLLLLQRGFDLPLKSRRHGAVPVIAATGQHGTHEVARVPGPGVVTGRSGSLGTVMYVAEDFWPLNTTLWVKEFRRATPELATYVLRELGLAQFNSGAAVPTLNRNDLSGQPVALPPVELVNRFSVIAQQALRLMATFQRSCDVLMAGRDLLLPRLISGAVDVSSLDLDAVVESVA